MKRNGTKCLMITRQRFDELTERYQKYYNKIIVTNETIKHPNNCPKGKKKCKLCQCPKKSGKYNRKIVNRQLKKNITYEIF